MKRELFKTTKSTPNIKSQISGKLLPSVLLSPRYLLPTIEHLRPTFEDSVGSYGWEQNFGQHFDGLGLVLPEGQTLRCRVMCLPHSFGDLCIWCVCVGSDRVFGCVEAAFGRSGVFPDRPPATTTRLETSARKQPILEAGGFGVFLLSLSLLLVLLYARAGVPIWLC